MSDLPTPVTREERYLNGIAQGDPSDLPTPISREEQYLDYIARNGGGGSGDGDMKKSVYDSDLAVARAGGIKAFVSDAVSDSEKDIYAVMGEMGAKNKLPFDLNFVKSIHTSGTWEGNAYTRYGVTFNIVTDDKGNLDRVDVSGKATADAQLVIYGRTSNQPATNIIFDSPMIASIGVVGSSTTVRGVIWGSNSLFIDDEEITLEPCTLYGLGLRVVNGYEIPEGGISFKPMIRCASITDDTYEPYAKSNLELTNEKAQQAEVNDIVNRLGAKSIIPFPYYRESGYSSNGMTTTYGDDGILTVNKEVGSSTAYFLLYTNSNDTTKCFLTPNTKYKLFFEVADTTSISVYVNVNDGDIVAITKKADGKYSAEFTTPATFTTRLAVGIYTTTSDTETNAKVKVMITPANITDDTYVRPSKTNQQLTDEINAIECKEVTAGNYILKATVDASGNVAYSWVAETP